MQNRKNFRRETMKKKLLALLTVGLVACSAGLVACGHTCTYEKITSDETTLASAATCTSPAKYYYSCGECGALGDETFTDGDALGHTFTLETVKDGTLAAPATCQNAETHFKSCEACGAISTNEADVFTVGDVSKHNYNANGVCTHGCGTYNPYFPLRTGDDVNTLCFFDKGIGLDQLSIMNNPLYWYSYTREYTTDVKYGTEAGSLALTMEKQTAPEGQKLIDDQEDECIYWDAADYQFNEGDYIVFCVYNDTASDYIDISLAYTHRQRCVKGQWTMVIWSAADFTAKGSGYSRFYEGDWDGQNLPENPLAGKVYFSKVKVYSSEQVKDLTTVEDTFEYTVGNTTFIGKAEEVNGTYTPNSAAFNDASYARPFYVDGLLRWNVNPKDTSLWPAMGFTFKEANSMASNLYLYVTISNTITTRDGNGDETIDGGLYLKVFSSLGFKNGHYGSFYGELVETLDNGFATYKFHVGKYNTNAKAMDFAAFRLCADWITAKPVSTQFVVSDITVAYETPQA